jgi:hypothetical protein
MAKCVEVKIGPQVVDVSPPLEAALRSEALPGSDVDSSERINDHIF